MKTELFTITMAVLMIPMLAMFGLAAGASELEAGAAAQWISGDSSGLCKIFKGSTGPSSSKTGNGWGNGPQLGGKVMVDYCSDISRNAVNQCVEHIDQKFGCELIGPAVNDCTERPQCPG